MNIRRIGFAVAFACLWVAPVLAQTDADDPQDEQADRFARLREAAQKMIGGFQQLSDWDTQYQYLTDAVERVYERNQWTSEPDLFSLEMMRQVSRIPPWEMQERFDTAMGMIGDRYLLDDDQSAKLRQLVLQENLKVFSKHSDRIMEYAMDAVSTRAAGEPFTPEQVAHWAELARPVFQDSRQAMNQAAQKFMTELGPEQQELVKADLQAANARLDVVSKMSQQWIRGEWDPSDWGMEDDPIQRGVGSAHASDVAAGPDGSPDGGTAVASGAGAHGAPGDSHGASRPSGRHGSGASERRGSTDGDTRTTSATDQPGDAPPPPDGQPQPDPSGKTGEKLPDDEWARYVRGFIAKYKLNDEQEQRAWLFYKDSRTRGDAMTHRFERVTADIKTAEDERSAARFKEAKGQYDADMNRIFERLKERLEQLPTRAQRRAAEEAKPAKDDKKKP